MAPTPKVVTPVPITFQALLVAWVILIPGGLLAVGIDRARRVAGQRRLEEVILRYLVGSLVFQLLLAPFTYWLWSAYVRSGVLAEGGAVPKSIWILLLTYTFLPLLLGYGYGLFRYVYRPVSAKKGSWRVPSSWWVPSWAFFGMIGCFLVILLLSYLLYHLAQTPSITISSPVSGGTVECAPVKGPGNAEYYLCPISGTVTNMPSDREIVAWVRPISPPLDSHFPFFSAWVLQRFASSPGPSTGGSGRWSLVVQIGMPNQVPQNFVFDVRVGLVRREVADEWRSEPIYPIITSPPLPLPEESASTLVVSVRARV